MKCSNCHHENPDGTIYCGKCATPLKRSKEVPVSFTKTLQTTKEKLTTGATFAARYQIIEELGKGGMGNVYRVLDKKLNEEVALKVIKPEISSDDRTIERFSNELRLARKIGHKNVGRMFELMEDDGTHFITMEYVAGEDLDSFIRRSGQLTIGKALSIARQVCEGLEEAHRLGVVHRDLKPANIMIDKMGEARIMDFGIARSLETKGLTGTQVMIGTPAYMSPEQAAGEDVDYRSDIYSFGIILYEMVTGRVPFGGDTPLSVCMKHKTEKPPDPRKMEPQIPESLSRLILKCLEKDKEKRYQNAGELLSALHNIAVGNLKGKQVVGKKEEKSIAVLPFTDLSPQKDLEYFCDGIAEELISALAKVKLLQVASRTSSYQFKGKGYDISEIGKKLNVQTVLEGSLRKAGNRIRITAQLVDVANGYHVWSEKYDRDMEDIFAIQDEISLAIVEKLRVQLLKEEKEALAKRHTDNIEAYHAYLKGRYFWNRRYEGGLQKSLEFFNNAIATDPAYGLAYAGIADSYNLLGLYSWLPPKEAYSRAKAAAEKALEIDDTLGEAHASLGWIRCFFDWDWSAAEREFKRAIDLNQNYATAHEWYGLFLATQRRFDEAIREINRAQELDSLSLIISAIVGVIFYLARRYDEALGQFRETLEMDPNFSVAYLYQGEVYLSQAMWKEAIDAFQKGVALSPESTFAVGSLGSAYGMSGQKDKALKIMQRLDELEKERYVSPLYRAMISMGLAENDQSFEHLEKAYLERESYLTFLKEWPLFDSLRSFPRFAALLEKIDLER
jgi:serine/threonine protein kinase/Flp pilus assembly protein TadD